MHNDSSKSRYSPYPELIGEVIDNAEQQDATTIDCWITSVFSHKPVSSFFMALHTNVWIAADEYSQSLGESLVWAKN